MGLLGKLKGVILDQPPQPAKQSARLYEYGSRYFICSVRWIAEIGTPSVLPCDVDSEELGVSILRHLSEFDPSELDLRDRKKSDWPAFQASGAKSVKQFEADAWYCDLSKRGTCFEVWAGPCMTLNQDLSAYSAANGAIPGLIGEAVRNALSGAKAMRRQEVL